MKHFSLLAIICLLACSGCKKETPSRTIQLKITVPAHTTYNLSVRNNSGTLLLLLDHATTNSNEPIVAKSGDKLTMSYGFITDGYQYGQGTAIFTYNGQTLVTINGGNGTRTLDVP
jgi:hypothetical protein